MLPAILSLIVCSGHLNAMHFIYLLLKSYSKYKIDRDTNITHDTDINTCVMYTTGTRHTWTSASLFQSTV